MTIAPRLAVRDVSKVYGPVTALDDVTLEVYPGEIVGLIGQNGSGKSTLMKMLSGTVMPDRGTLELNGAPVRIRSAADAARRGIGVVYQEQSLVPNLTVAENVLLGSPTAATRGGVYRWKRLFRAAQAQLQKLGCTFSASEIVERLTFLERQMVELTRALFVSEQGSAGIVLLDEPTSLLNPDEVSTLFSELRWVKKQGSVIFVSHRMDEVLEISDRVYVMSNGRIVAELQPKDADERQLYRLMVGEEMGADYYASGLRAVSANSDMPVLEAHLRRSSETEELSLSIGRGKVLGIGGVVGSGREELCRSLFGLSGEYRGDVLIDGAPAKLHSTRQAIRRGVGYVPAERKIEGVVMGQSIDRNLTYGDFDQISTLGFVKRKAERALVSAWVDKLRIKIGSTSDDIASLSGGNQQKVVLAKWLSTTGLRLLILDHPTRGLDLGAKADVYQQVREATSRGIGVILLADTLEELFGLSDDVMIMRDGRVTAQYHDVQACAPALDEVVKEMV